MERGLCCAPMNVCSEWYSVDYWYIMEIIILMIGGDVMRTRVGAKCSRNRNEGKSAKCSSKNYARRPPLKPIPPKGK